MNNIDEETMKLIQRVIDIHAPCYNVSGYELEDIKQEAFIICMGIIKKWDGIRPLENFLVISLSHRLKTFVRDKGKLQGGFADINQKIQSPIDIDNVDWDTERALISEDNVAADVDYRDLVRAIDQYLPISLRKDYLQMRAGVKINRSRQEKIRHYITLLLEELRGENE
jgi:DNA-directed RNA polymerase specialized sigma24 family protein